MPKKAPEPVAEPEPQEEVPQVPQEGNGKFEYINGTSYEGDWKLFDGVKKKHGHGRIVHGNSHADSHGNEVYEGEWVEDLMHGTGTYTFTSGATYHGQWIKGKRHGVGKIEYPDGSSYDGQWENDMMHGNGKYTDNDGIEWEGIFVDNTFESKIQKKLQTERKVMVSKSLNDLHLLFFKLLNFLYS